MCIDFELKVEAYVTASALNITVIADSYNLWYFFIIKLLHSHVHGNLVSRANAVFFTARRYAQPGTSRRPVSVRLSHSTT